MKTYVYIIEQVGGQYSKIGVSDSPVRRMAQLQRKNPDRIAIRYILEPTSERLAYALEAQLHRRFHALRLDGEWFRIGAKDALNAIYADFEAMGQVARIVEYPEWVIEPAPIRRLPQVKITYPNFNTRAMGLFLLFGVLALTMLYGVMLGEIRLAPLEVVGYLTIALASVGGMLSVSVGSRLYGRTDN